MKNYIIKASEYKDQGRRDREVERHEKVMHGQFLRDTDWIADKEQPRLWLKNGDLKKETEALKKESFINATRQKDSQILTELILITKHCSFIIRNENIFSITFASLIQQDCKQLSQICPYTNETENKSMKDPKLNATR